MELFSVKKEACERRYLRLSASRCR